MAVSHNAAQAAFIADAIGEGFESGTVEFRSAADDVLCTITFGATDWDGDALAASVNGTAGANADGATACTKAVFIDSGATRETTVSVSETAGGGDIEFDETTWTNGGTVTLSSFNFTQPLS